MALACEEILFGSPGCRQVYRPATWEADRNRARVEKRCRSARNRPSEWGDVRGCALA